MLKTVRHVQVESNQKTIKVCGQIGNFGATFQGKGFPCHYKQHIGNHGSMVSIITPDYRWENFQSQYGLGSDEMSGGYEMLKMDIIKILQEQGLQVVSTMFDQTSGTEKLMMAYTYP